MQIGQSGSLPASPNVQAPRPEPSQSRPEPSQLRPEASGEQAGEASRVAPRRVAPVAAHAEPTPGASHRNLPRGTLINITV